ncbi:FkbM family methyltransferase [Nitrosomonas sp. ANs5]|uniref:FkbM family methyltransferase n=1 Tax=Nitrosomonas sp. ANs5 TaxID=3423941 RepID=UPI003D34D138
MSNLFSVEFLKNLVVAAYAVKGGAKTVQVRGQPIQLTVDHWRVLKRIRTYSVKEPDTLDWLDSFEPGACYFDIGANIGQYSLYPAKKFGAGIRVFAFEPQSNNYYALNKNIWLNDLKDQITAYCVAIGGNNGFDKLYVPKFIPGGNRSQFGRESLEAMKVPASHVQGMFGVTLDELCAKWGFPYPNYIKIDVDGIEIQILKAAGNVLRHPNLRSVIVELGTDAEQQEAIEIMRQAGLALKARTTQNWGETCCVFEPDPASA